LDINEKSAFIFENYRMDKNFSYYNEYDDSKVKGIKYKKYKKKRLKKSYLYKKKIKEKGKSTSKIKKKFAKRKKTKKPGMIYSAHGYFGNGILMSVQYVEKKTKNFSIEIWYKSGGKKEVFVSDNDFQNIFVDRKDSSKAVFCQDNPAQSSCYLISDNTVSILNLEKSFITVEDFNAGKLLFISTNYSLPPTLFLLDVREKSTKKIHQTGEKVDKAEVLPIYREIPSFDGTKIEFYSYIPKNSKAPYHILFLLPDYPEKCFRPHYNSFVNYLNDLGFMVVIPNLRGSGCRGFAYAQLDNGHGKSDVVKDIGAIADDLIAKGYGFKDKFALFGLGYGGFLTISAMAYFSEYFRCGIPVSSFIDLRGYLQTAGIGVRGVVEKEYGDLNDKSFLAAISPINMIERLSGSLFFFHGMNNYESPPVDITDFVTELRKRGKTADYYLLEGESSEIVKRENIQLIYEKSASFLGHCFKLNQSVPD